MAKLLSASIREGAKLRPQSFGAFFGLLAGETGSPDEVRGSCPLGAAWEANFGSMAVSLSFPRLNRRLGLTGNETISVPGYGDNPLFNGIEIMADNLRMSREDIADYIEQFGY